MRTIKEWQVYIRDWAKRKGFHWTLDDIDTVLLRLHSEVSEASEDARDLNWDHIGEEFADIFIRLADVCEVLKIDLEAEVEKKMVINEARPHLHGRARR